ncbi:MAG: NADH-quinone oxidoreductase subunit A [Planctomycetes bacterium]|nr:NADH-quinone oxidoreductase subunit A [Planctomycetota bacterium]
MGQGYNPRRFRRGAPAVALPGGGTVSPTFYSEYANVLIFFLVGAAFVVLNVAVVSRLLRPHTAEANKDSTYECGEPTVGSAWVRFDIRFYTVALVFIVFDVEVAFLYPWAVVFQRLSGAGPFALLEMLIFVAILAVGLVYVWAKGDLDWVKSMDAQADRARP